MLPPKKKTYFLTRCLCFGPSLLTDSGHGVCSLFGFPRFLIIWGANEKSLGASLRNIRLFFQYCGIPFEKCLSSWEMQCFVKQNGLPFGENIS